MPRPLSELRASLPMRAFEPVRHRLRWRDRFARPRRAKGLPIVVTGGIGDNVVAYDLIRQIRLREPDTVVYTDHPSTLEYLGIPHVKTTAEFRRHDYSLWVNAVPRFVLDKNFASFTSDAIANMFLGWKVHETDKVWGPLIHRHPYLDNSMAHEALKLGLNRHSLAFHLMGMKPSYEVLDTWPPTGDTITVHDGFETAQAGIKRATKTWSIEHWAHLVRLLKEAYPRHKVIQLGGKTSRRIPCVDVDMVGAQLHDSFNTLIKSSMHIDGDSGLVHMAARFGVRSVVMFGPTNREFFGYPRNLNLKSSSCEGGCWWLTRDWLARCPVGHATPVCMDGIWPHTVMKAAAEVIPPRRRR